MANKSLIKSASFALRAASESELSSDEVESALGINRTKEDQVADFLRENIISGAFRRGQRLKQAEIARILGTSITPVREALKLLEAEGYVIATSHKGVAVAPFEVEQLEDCFELRSLLEIRLTQRALTLISDLDLRVLSDLNQELMTGERTNLRDANYRFHFALYAIAQLPQTLHFVRVLWAKFPFDLLGTISNRQSRVASEHESFLEHARKGDHQRAVQAMRAHIQSGWRELKANYSIPHTSDRKSGHV